MALNAAIVTGFFAVASVMVTEDGTVGFLRDESGAEIAFTAKRGEFPEGREVYVKAQLNEYAFVILESKITGATAPEVIPQAAPQAAPEMTLDQAKALIAADKREKAELAKANKARKITATEAIASAVTTAATVAEVTEVITDNTPW